MALCLSFLIYKIGLVIEPTSYNSQEG
jgi:hypothetical protein